MGRSVKDSVKDKEREPGIQASREEGELVRIDEYSHKNKENPTDNRNNAHMFFEPVEIFEKGIDPERCEEEGDSQTQ